MDRIKWTTTTIKLDLPTELLAELDELAEERETTLGTLIHDALSDLLHREGPRWELEREMIRKGITHR